MVDFVLFSSGNNSNSDISIVSLLNIHSCVKAAEQYYFWLLILLIFPAVINCFSLAISLMTIIHVRQLKSVTEAVTSSIHWLARTASRIGLGIIIPANGNGFQHNKFDGDNEQSSGLVSDKSSVMDLIVITNFDANKKK
ncbi:Protein NLRC5 [Dirofilaria immitis]